MNAKEFKERTQDFALAIIELVESLPDHRVAWRLGDQLLRAGTSVGANYRAAARAKSAADFISKMGTVEEECDESLYWMELLTKRRLIDQDIAAPLMDEANQILAMTVASIRTARSNK